MLALFMATITIWQLGSVVSCSSDFEFLCVSLANFPSLKVLCLLAEVTGALVGYCSKVELKELVMTQSTVDITSYISSTVIFWAMDYSHVCMHNTSLFKV